MGELMGRREVETASYIVFARRVIRGAARRVGEADDWELAELVSLQKELDAAIATAVAGQRAMGRSWQYVGDALGITRQAAQQRFGGRATS